MRLPTGFAAFATVPDEYFTKKIKDVSREFDEFWVNNCTRYSIPGDRYTSLPCAITDKNKCDH